MSRRQHLTLVLSVRLPVPAGKTQADAAKDLTEALHSALPSAYAKSGIVVKTMLAERTYL